jgi:hypothetical protein
MGPAPALEVPLKDVCAGGRVGAVGGVGARGGRGAVALAEDLGEDGCSFCTGVVQAVTLSASETTKAGKL